MRTDQEILDDIALSDTVLAEEKGQYPLNYNTILMIEVLLDNRQYLKQIFEKPACPEGISYVDRGDPSVEDFIRTDLVADAAWHELDLSSIVPADGASQLVHLKAKVEAQIAKKKILFSKLGRVNDINLVRLGTQVPYVQRTIDTFVKMDADRKIQYKMDSEGAVESAIYARWRLNESSGSVAPDDSGNGYNGTLINMEDVDWVPGQVNNCLQFDGVNEYVDLGDIADFERTDPFSIEGWIKTSQKGIIIGKEQWAPPYRGWYVGISPTGALQLVLTNTWGTNQLSAYQDDVNMIDDAWHHFVITYDGLSSVVGVKFYVDDQLRTTKGSPSTLSGTIKNTIDCQMSGANGSNELFAGKLDEVIIYDVELPNVLDAWLQADLSVRGWFEAE